MWLRFFVFDIVLTMKASFKSSLVERLKPYCLIIPLLALATLLGEWGKRHLDPANLVVVYLLLVVWVAVKWGRGPAIWTSALSVLVFDFFLIPPYLTLTVEDTQYLFTLAGFLIVGLLISELIIKAREQEKKVKELELVRESEKLQAALFNSISHDLRTPLVSITGTLSMLLHDSSWLDEQTKKELIENAFEQSDRLNRLVSNLLDMSRVEAGVLKPILKPCDLTDVIGVALEELKEKLKDRVVEVQIPGGFEEIRVDFSLIVKVFVNLIDNAMKYSDEKSPIKIFAHAEASHARVEIMDAGCGIPVGDLKKVFDKFYRAENLNQARGMGLGLSICRGIIEAHQGEIWAKKNQNSKGTTIVVLLPLKVKHEK